MRPIQQLLEVGLKSPNATTFVEQADEWCAVFGTSVHVGVPPDDEQPGFSQVYLAWLMAVKSFVSVPLIGKMVRDAGLSSDEAAVLMSRGELDLWSDVEMPVPNPAAPAG
jgi:hypothetical protein